MVFMIKMIINGGAPLNLEKLGNIKKIKKTNELQDNFMKEQIITNSKT
jgi:hypothetical protein